MSDNRTASLIALATWALDNLPACGALTPKIDAGRRLLADVAEPAEPETIHVMGSTDRDVPAWNLGRFDADVGGAPFRFVVTYVKRSGESPSIAAGVTHCDSGMAVAEIAARTLAERRGDYVAAGRLALAEKVAEVGPVRARTRMENWRAQLAPKVKGIRR